MKITYADLAPQYGALWWTCELKKPYAAEVAAHRVSQGRSTYEAVERRTGVPWYAVGLIHAMEAGAAFGKHLHNGDDLQAQTVHAPKGRPLRWGPPYDWVESACDALAYDKLDKVADWTLERICFALESFNGWGYRHLTQTIPTPYLWSGTNHYTVGKFGADGAFDPTLVSKQTGAMGILKELLELCPDIVLRVETPQPASHDDADRTLTADSYRKALAPREMGTGTKIGIGGVLGTAAGEAAKAVMTGDPIAKARATVDQGQAVRGIARDAADLAVPILGLPPKMLGGGFILVAVALTGWLLFRKR